MTWLLNALTKPGDTTVIPGTPGTPGNPGSPEVPGYWVVGSTEQEWKWSDLEPNVIDDDFSAHRYFDGRKFAATSFIDGDPLIYVYHWTGEAVSIWVPPVPAVPPTEGVPATEHQIIEDYRLGWDGGATGPAALTEGDAIKWRFHSGNVGAVVGVTKTTARQDQGYLGMVLAVMSTSGQYSIWENGAQVVNPRAHTSDSMFSITRSTGGQIILVVDGAIMRTVEYAGDVVPDSSIYSAGDEIWDAKAVSSNAGVPEGEEGSTPSDIVVNAGFSALSISDAGFAPTAGQVIAGPIVTPTFGPGTARGVIAGSTISDAVAGSVLVNGTLFVGMIAASTISYGEATPYIIPTLGAGTDLGSIASSTLSAGAVDYTERLGTADLSFRPLLGTGSVDGVYRAFVGDYAGDALSLEPLEVESNNGMFTPGFGIADCVMVPMTNSGTGVGGEVVISSLGSMAPMEAGAGDTVYAGGDCTTAPLTVYASDAALAEVGYAILFVSSAFSIRAFGREAGLNSATLRSRDAFSVIGSGGAQIKGQATFAIEAEGTGANIGELRAVVGYA